MAVAGADEDNGFEEAENEKPHQETMVVDDAAEGDDDSAAGESRDGEAAEKSEGESLCTHACTSGACGRSTHPFPSLTLLVHFRHLLHMRPNTQSRRRA